MPLHSAAPPSSLSLDGFHARSQTGADRSMTSFSAPVPSRMLTCPLSMPIARYCPSDVHAAQSILLATRTLRRDDEGICRTKEGRRIDAGHRSWRR